MKKRFSSRLLLALQEPWPIFEDEVTFQQNALSDISNLSKSLIAAIHNEPREFDVKCLGEKEAKSQRLSWSPPRPVMARPYNLIVLSTSFTVDLHKEAETLRKQNSTTVDLSDIDVAELVSSMIATDLMKLAGDMVLAGAIAHPGGFEPLEVIAIVNSKTIYRHTLEPSSMSSAVEEAKLLEWPPLLKLNFLQTWSWLNDIPGFDLGMPGSSVGRAVSALSQLTGWSSSPSPAIGLMWCMVGLEALYTKGKQGLSEQFFDKTQVFLGSVSENKKVFKGLYDFRSRLVHGDIDFPLAHTPYDAVETYEKFSEEASDAESRALAILIATFQRLVIRKQHKLDFQYKLIEIESDN